MDPQRRFIDQIDEYFPRTFALYGHVPVFTAGAVAFTFGTSLRHELDFVRLNLRPPFGWFYQLRFRRRPGGFAPLGRGFVRRRSTHKANLDRLVAAI